MTRVLSAVREGLGVDCSPMLYRLTAGDCVPVDRAGYLHVDRAMAPSGLLDVSATEPDGVVATETLRSVQVKRTAVRPLVTWLDEREVGAAVVVREEDVAVGLLLWPAAGRVAPLAYDEVVALRQLADHLGAVVGASALLARSRARQVEADVVIGEAEGQVATLRREVEDREARQRALAEMTARPLSIATASPAGPTSTRGSAAFGHIGYADGVYRARWLGRRCRGALRHISPRLFWRPLVSSTARRRPSKRSTAGAKKSTLRSRRRRGERSS